MARWLTAIIADLTFLAISVTIKAKLKIGRCLTISNKYDILDWGRETQLGLKGEAG